MSFLTTVEKYWLESKTIRINLAFLLLSMMSAVPLVMDDIHEINPVWWILLTLIQPPINMFLRRITNQPITFNKDAKSG